MFMGGFGKAQDYYSQGFRQAEQFAEKIKLSCSNRSVMIHLPRDFEQFLSSSEPSSHPLQSQS